MRSRLVLVPLFLAGCLLSPAPARAQSSPWSAGSTSLRLYAGAAPGQMELRDFTWGYGATLLFAMSDHVALALDGARFETLASTDFRTRPQTVYPATVGFSFGPVTRGALRPRLEAGFGLYTTHSSVADQFAYGSHLTRVSFRNVTDRAAGAYFGLGVDWRLSESLAASGSARAHAWDRGEGFGFFQLGLTYRLSGVPGGEWASR